MALPLLLAGVRVLVIDDDATFCRYLVEVLASDGHQADSADDALVGFERCLRERYDAVICDVRMPLMLGTELVAELRRDLPDLPVILISAFADEHVAAQAAFCKARLLSKPFDATALEHALAEITAHPAVCNT